MKIITQYLSAVLIAFLGINTSNAQTVSFGPMLGTNVTSFSNVQSATFIPGLSAGGFLNYSVNENVGINGKLLFSQFGSGYKNSTFQNRFNYIQVPVSAVLFLGDQGNRIRPKLYAGIYAANLQNGGDAANVGPTLIGQTKFKNFDFGGQVGLGFNYRVLPRTWLNVDLGYTAGLLNIAETPSSGIIRNKGYNLNVGLAFPLFGY